MITVPTGDLTGILCDAVPFASTDKEAPSLNCVRLEWDGEQFHAAASDRYRVAISSWHPDDQPDVDTQDDLFTRWGGGDDPWSIILPLDDAKDLISAYKLGPKELRVPLTVDCDRGRLKVVRSRDTGHSAITMVIEGPLVEFPDVRKLLDNLGEVQPFATLAYTAKLLADFAKVRPRGPLELTFTGEKGFTRVAIGGRFVGGIATVQPEKEDGA